MFFLVMMLAVMTWAVALLSSVLFETKGGGR
jgi:hypothetical protein